jgi:hypothetical protein
MANVNKLQKRNGLKKEKVQKVYKKGECGMFKYEDVFTNQ